MKSRPIIIIGMHRSGTSLATRILADCGLFIGRSRDRNEEARFFLELNQWILRQSAATWDRPENICDLLAHPKLRDLTVRYITNLLHKPEVARYLGWRNYLAYRTPAGLPFPWGWKDPRNTFTLPIWLDLFPDAKVIHLYRHGVDVAQSLNERQTRLLHVKAQYAEPKLRYWLRPPRLEARAVGGSFADSPRCLSLEGGFALWEEYMRAARGYVAKVGDRALEVKYEDALTRPEVVRSLVEFAGLDASEQVLEGMRARLDRGRAYAFRSSPRLCAFEREVGPRLNEFGY